MIAVELRAIAGEDAVLDAAAVAERVAMPPYKCAASLLVPPRIASDLLKL